jgi:hypothetical protein
MPRTKKRVILQTENEPKTDAMIVKANKGNSTFQKSGEQTPNIKSIILK